MLQDTLNVSPPLSKDKTSVGTNSLDNVGQLRSLAYGGEEKLPPPPMLTAEEERRLWRKIDVRLIPVVTALYLVSFLDRGNIGNAKLQGLVSQLELTGNRYNIALTMYFVSHSVFAIPANLLLKKLRPSRWLPGITVAWGIVCTLMGLVKTYPQLVGARICIGVAEAGLGCGVFYLLSLWYPRHMLQTRVGMFWGGATIASAFSGLLAYGISFMSGRGGLLGWSWIFIIEGLLTVAVGIVAFFVLVDLPDTATFLTLEERAFVVHRKKFDNSSVGEEEHFEARHIMEALLDWQVWAISFVNMTITAAVYGISLFLPSILNGFGYSIATSQLLSIPPYLVAVIMVVVWAHWSDTFKMRSPSVVLGLVLCIIGYAIQLSNAGKGMKYFGTFFVAVGGYASYPAVNAWLPNNTSGHYKRAVALSVIVMFGNLGGIIASNIYRAEEAPRYRLGHGLEILVIGLGLVTTPGIVLAYIRINAQRDARQRSCAGEKDGAEYAPEVIRRLGDRAPDFRYML